MERHVLVVFPHPDDETLATGGAIAHHAKTGAMVTYACFTLGQMGRNMGNPFFATRESLPTIRERELRAACAELGVTDLRLIGYRDKTLEFEEQARLVGEIDALLTELQPSLVITYYPGYCVHPDHEALAAAVIAAIRKLPASERPALQCQAFSQDHEAAIGAPDVVIDTSGVWQSVLGAMKAHASQTSAWVAPLEQQLVATAAERDAVVARLSRQTLYTYAI